MTQPDRTLGSGWKTSTDRSVTAVSDSDGVHLLVADGKNAYAWRTVAVPSEPGMPADTWIGNECVVDHSHAAIVYAPRSFTNRQDLMLGGAFTAIVDLDNGTVTKLPFTASLAYFDPSCDPATHTAAFSTFRDGRTHLVTVDTAGTSVADTTVAAEATSAVPVADGTSRPHAINWSTSTTRPGPGPSRTPTVHRPTSTPPVRTPSLSWTTRRGRRTPRSSGRGKRRPSPPGASVTYPWSRPEPPRCSSPVTPRGPHT